MTPSTGDRQISGDDQVLASWNRIEGWLTQHAPRTLRSLNPPGQFDEIRAAEQSLGVVFPPDLVTSLLRHDGVRGEDDQGEVDPAAFCLPSEHRPLSVTEIVAMTGLLRSVQSDSATGEWWRPSYLLVASYDVTTDGTVLDCNSGRTGVFSRMSGCTFVGPASLGGLLAEAADGLEQGRAVFIDMDEEEIADEALDAVPLNERAVIWP